MSLLKPVEQMTVKELEARIRFHEGMADTFWVMHEPSMAARTRELSAKYLEELQKRIGGAGEAGE